MRDLDKMLEDKMAPNKMVLNKIVASVMPDKMVHANFVPYLLILREILDILHLLQIEHRKKMLWCVVIKR